MCLEEILSWVAHIKSCKAKRSIIGPETKSWIYPQPVRHSVAIYSNQYIFSQPADGM